jgi:lactoylglutathione lyase
MRYAQTIVYVPDPAAAVRFFTEAFGLERGFAAPDDSYVVLGGEGGQLAFASHEMVATSIGDEARRPPAGFEVWIEADDVPAAVDAARAAGAELVAEPVEKPWGQTVAYVRSPDGVLVELGTPVSTSAP